MKIEEVPELTLPIIKPNRDYFCQYCDKVGKEKSPQNITQSWACVQAICLCTKTSGRARSVSEGLASKH